MSMETVDSGSTYTPARVVGGIPYLESYLTLAERISRTAMVPPSLRNKPDEVLAVVMYGAELGIGPMQALQQIEFISGKPSAKAELLRALVLEAGHLIVVSGDRETAVAECKRKDWDEARTTTFTIGDAQLAGLLGKDGWKKYPDQMLTARVTSKACRMWFADVIAGMSYVPEEIEAFTPATHEAPKRQARQPRATTETREAPRSGTSLVEDGDNSGPASEDQRDFITQGIGMLTDAERDDFHVWWVDNGLPPLKNPSFTANNAEAVKDHLHTLLDDPGIVEAELVHEPTPFDIDERDDVPMITNPQIGKIRAMVGAHGGDVHVRASEIVGRTVTSLKELTKSEAHRIIDRFTEDAADDESLG